VPAEHDAGAGSPHISPGVWRMPVSVGGSYKTEAGFVVFRGRLGPGRHVDTIARHGEVAEWLKAAPC